MKHSDVVRIVGEVNAIAYQIPKNDEDPHPAMIQLVEKREWEGDDSGLNFGNDRLAMPGDWIILNSPNARPQLMTDSNFSEQFSDVEIISTDEDAWISELER